MVIYIILIDILWPIVIFTLFYAINFFYGILSLASTTFIMQLRRDSTVVKASKDIMISFNGLDMKLTITSASTELSGTYKVVVSNEYGQDESSARLVVKVRGKFRFRAHFNHKLPSIYRQYSNVNSFYSSFRMLIHIMIIY